MSNEGCFSHLEAENWRCERMKEGSDIVVHQTLLTHLKRRRDLTGSRIRISKTSSSGNSVVCTFFCFFPVFMAYMHTKEKETAMLLLLASGHDYICTADMMFQKLTTVSITDSD
jgi:hypothetical protein